MPKTARPPPKVLFVHDGRSPDAQVTYLRKEGLDVAQTHAEDAVAIAVDFLPDIIVLAFDCDGDTIDALRATDETRGIPIIALAELNPQSDVASRHHSR